MVLLATPALKFNKVRTTYCQNYNNHNDTGINVICAGYEAVPIELKILLDRLFASHHDQIRTERRHRLACLGWTEEDYQRGYKIRVSTTFMWIGMKLYSK